MAEAPPLDMAELTWIAMACADRASVLEREAAQGVSLGYVQQLREEAQFWRRLERRVIEVRDAGG